MNIDKQRATDTYGGGSDYDIKRGRKSEFADRLDPMHHSSELLEGENEFESILDEGGFQDETEHEQTINSHTLDQSSEDVTDDINLRLTKKSDSTASDKGKNNSNIASSDGALGGSVAVDGHVSQRLFHPNASLRIGDIGDEIESTVPGLKLNRGDLFEVESSSSAQSLALEEYTLKFRVSEGEFSGAFMNLAVKKGDVRVTFSEVSDHQAEKLRSREGEIKSLFKSQLSDDVTFELDINKA